MPGEIIQRGVGDVEERSKEELKEESKSKRSRRGVKEDSRRGVERVESKRSQRGVEGKVEEESKEKSKRSRMKNRRGVEGKIEEELKCSQRKFKRVLKRCQRGVKGDSKRTKVFKSCFILFLTNFIVKEFGDYQLDDINTEIQNLFIYQYSIEEDCKEKMKDIINLYNPISVIARI